MTRNELNEFIQKNLVEQGKKSSIVLGQLVTELIKYMPLVVHVSSQSDRGLKPDNNARVVVDSQDEINTIIDTIIGNEVSSVCVYDDRGKGNILHFSQIGKELFDGVLTCGLATPSGNYTLSLSKTEGLSKLTFNTTIAGDIS